MKIQALILTVFPSSYTYDRNTGNYRYTFPESLTKIIAPVSFVRNIPIISGKTSEIEFHKIVNTSRSHRESDSWNGKIVDRITYPPMPNPNIDDDVLELLKYMKANHFSKEIMRTVPSMGHRYRTSIRPGTAVKKGRLSISTSEFKDSLRYGDKDIDSYVVCLSGDPEAVEAINKARGNTDYVSNEEMTKVINQYIMNMTLPNDIPSLK